MIQFSVFIFSLFLIASPALGKTGPQCIELIGRKVPPSDVATLAEIFAGQDRIGHRYSLGKILDEVGMNPYLKFEDLTAEQIEGLRDHVRNDIETRGPPVIIFPNGIRLLMDNNHAMDGAYIFGIDPKTIEIHYEIEKDLRDSDMSMAEAIALAKKEKWFNAESVENLVLKPKPMNEVPDSAARSMMGFAFMAIRHNYDIPMRGKYFKNAVQLNIADLIIQKGLFDFKNDFVEKDVNTLVELMVTNEKVIEMVIDHLRKKAPNKLKEFWEEKLKKAKK